MDNRVKKELWPLKNHEVLKALEVYCDYHIKNLGLRALNAETFEELSRYKGARQELEKLKKIKEELEQGD